MNNWKDLLDEHHEALPILCITTDLENPHLTPETWDRVRELYEEVNEDGRVEGRVMVSIINAILTQRRFIFCLSRERTRNLVQTDVNHENSRGFDNDAWRRVLSFLIKKVGLIKCEREGKGQQPSIYSIDAPWLVDLVEGTDRGQWEQCWDFVHRTGEYSQKKQTDKIKEKIQNEFKKEQPRIESQKEKEKKQEGTDQKAPSGATRIKPEASFSWDDFEEQPALPDWLVGGTTQKEEQ